MVGSKISSNFWLWNGLLRGLLFVLPLTATGCGSMRAVRLTDADPAARERVPLFEQRSACLHSFRGLSRSRLTLQGESYRLRHLLLLDVEGRLRIEVFPSNMGLALQVLAASGSSFTFLDVNEREAYQGNNPALILKRLLGVPLQPQALAAAFLGFSQHSAQLPSEAKSLRVEDSALTLRLDTNHDGSVDQQWQLDALGRPLSAEIRDTLQGSQKINLRYTDYQLLGQPACWLARGIEIEFSNGTLQLVFSDPELNVPLDAEFFELELPAGYALRSLGQGE